MSFLFLSIQTSHWHTIFAGFNEQYDPRQNYTLNYFLEREPSKFSDLINKVYWLASQQSRLREKVREEVGCICHEIITIFAVSVNGEDVGDKDNPAS